MVSVYLVSVLLAAPLAVVDLGDYPLSIRSFSLSKLIQGVMY